MMYNCQVFLFVIFLCLGCSKSQTKSSDFSNLADEADRSFASNEDEFLEEEHSLIITNEEREQDELIKESINIDLSNHQDKLLEFTDLTREIPGTYYVRKGETLILISFKIYGTTKMWRVLYQLNRDKIGVDYKLERGTKLYYPIAKNPYRRPMGNPYLVKSGDSLSLISDLVYGDYKKWPKIWKNNKRMIYDPNLIFAGFTLFYPKLNNPTSELALY